jgi:hypothetical protein
VIFTNFFPHFWLLKTSKITAFSNLLFLISPVKNRLPWRVEKRLAMGAMGVTSNRLID